MTAQWMPITKAPREEGFSAFVVIDDLASLGSGSVGVIHSEEMSWKLIHQSLVVSRSL